MIAYSLRFAASRRLLALVALVSIAPVAAFGQAVAAPEADTEVAVDTGMKTIAVAAVAGYDELLTDIDFLGELGGRPETAKMVEGMLAFFTGGRGLEGLDKTRPIGVVLQTDGSSFTPIGCLPIADLAPVLELAENFGFEPLDAGDGVYELELPEQTIYFQQSGEWTYVAQSPLALADAPADPSSMLKKLVATYDLGVTLMAQNVPDMYRQIALEQLRQGMEEGLVQEEDETEEDFLARRELAESQIEQLGDLIEGLDIVTIGWCIDAEGKRTFIDAELTGAEGSDMALAMSVYESSTSGVTGFHRPTAAASILTAGKTPPALLEKQKEQTEAAIEMARTQIHKAMKEQAEKGKLPSDPAVRDAIEGATDDLLDAYAEMLRNGRIEIGGSLALEGEGFDLIAGAYVVDPSKVESAFKKLANAAEGQKDFPGVEWNYDEHAGVTLHGMTIPIPDNEEAAQARMMFGDSMRVTMGVGPERVYLAAGPRGEASLKKAIDESAAMADKTIAPGEVILSVQQLLAASERFAPPEAAPMVGLMLDALEDAPEGTDRLVMTTEAIDRGVRIRYLIEQGVLEAIGKAAANAAAQQQQQQGGGPGGF